MAVREITCREFVELVTDYLEGRMAADRRLLFEEHLAFCTPCVTYLEQMRRTIALTGSLRERDLEPAARDAMLHVFREFAG
jgi:anti-sigma factor RsiW